MNERIRELAKQADGVFIHKLMTGAKQYTFLEKDLEKFAELIVRECIDIVNPTQHHEAFAQGYLGDVDGLELLAGKVKQIQQHFGVEE